MANHVGETWKAMCHNAWQRPMHVGHMANHVCDTWHALCQHAWHMENPKNMVWELFVEGGSNKKKKEGKKRRGKARKEREGKKREKEGEERERERRRKGKWCFDDQNSLD